MMIKQEQQTREHPMLLLEGRVRIVKRNGPAPCNSILLNYLGTLSPKIKN